MAEKIKASKLQVALWRASLDAAEAGDLIKALVLFEAWKKA